MSKIPLPPRDPWAHQTGVKEQRRRCNDCKQTFPTTDASEKKCPQCGSTNTEPVSIGQ